MSSSPWFVWCVNYLLHIRWESSPDLTWFCVTWCLQHLPHASHVRHPNGRALDRGEDVQRCPMVWWETWLYVVHTEVLVLLSRSRRIEPSNTWLRHPHLLLVDFSITCWLYPQLLLQTVSQSLYLFSWENMNFRDQVFVLVVEFRTV